MAAATCRTQIPSVIRCLAVAALLSLLLTTASCVPRQHLPGQRLLTIQIEVDGKIAFEGSRGVPDSTPITEMWNVIGDVRFQTSPPEPNPAKEGQPSKRVLVGPIVVRILHVTDALAEATFKDLRLHFDTSEDAWLLDQNVAEKIRQQQLNK